MSRISVRSWRGRIGTRAQRVAFRALPALITLVIVVVSDNLVGPTPELQAQGWGGAPLTLPISPLETPQELPCPVVGELIGLSEQAAALTGALALIERDSRPQAASRAAAEIRALQRRAQALIGGAELAGVLEDLADALDGYAGGKTSALGDVREASAHNARIREDLFQQKSECGGV